MPTLLLRCLQSLVCFFYIDACHLPVAALIHLAHHHTLLTDWVYRVLRAKEMPKADKVGGVPRSVCLPEQAAELKEGIPREDIPGEYTSTEHIPLGTSANTAVSQRAFELRGFWAP